MTDVVIGCDFGLRKTGVVVMDYNYNIISENLLQTSASDKAGERLYKMELAFDAIMARTPYPKTLFIEGYNFGATFQRESLAELGGVMRRYFFINKLQYWVMPPKSLKLFVSGNGAANKNFMKKMTKERWGLDFKSDDVCDAHGLARAGVTVLQALRAYHPTRPNFVMEQLSAKERRAINDLVTYPEHFINANTAKRRTKKGVKK